MPSDQSTIFQRRDFIVLLSCLMLPCQVIAWLSTSLSRRRRSYSLFQIILMSAAPLIGLLSGGSTLNEKRKLTSMQMSSYSLALTELLIKNFATSLQTECWESRIARGESQPTTTTELKFNFISFSHVTIPSALASLLLSQAAVAEQQTLIMESLDLISQNSSEDLIASSGSSTQSSSLPSSFGEI